MRTGCRQALAVNNRDFFFFTVLSFRILAYVFSWGIQGAAKYFVGKGITLKVSECQECQSAMSGGCTFLNILHIEENAIFT
jgi:hypothetical protein